MEPAQCKQSENVRGAASRERTGGTGRLRFISLLRIADGLRNIDRYHAAHPGLLHRDADQRLGIFHRDAMVRNDEELRINAHFSTKTRESSLICFIERGVDFVEQTEGGGVELKHGKDERRGRERLFAARQKPHGLIALAGR